MTASIVPPFLSQGDALALVATARFINTTELNHAVDVIESWGFHVVAAPNVSFRNFQLAGTLEDRISALQVALDDPNIKAILPVRGGYGTVHLIDQLDFSSLLKNPKWICGYSDITCLHAHLNNNLDIATIHSTMPVSFQHASEDALIYLKRALTGNLNTIAFNSNGPDVEPIQGKIIGGNLSVLASLLGSPQQMITDQHFLFIEDVDEMFYHIDRMMMAMLRSGSLDGVQGIIAGGFTQMKDNTKHFGFKENNPWGASPLDTIVQVADQLGVPFFPDFPAGHIVDNRAFYLNRECHISRKHGLAHVSYE
jgi:muramoyltetrapeptide carboxypeptidase